MLSDRIVGKREVLAFSTHVTKPHISGSGSSLAVALIVVIIYVVAKERKVNS